MATKPGFFYKSDWCQQQIGLESIFRSLGSDPLAMRRTVLGLGWLREKKGKCTVLTRLTDTEAL